MLNRPSRTAARSTAHSDSLRRGLSLFALTVAFGLSGAAQAQCQTLADTLLPGAGERFNNGRIALSADGSTLIVGDSSIQSAYFYARQNNAWVRQATFNGPSFFGRGTAVSADGNIAAVSAENANVAALVNIYTRTAGVWSPAQTLTYNGAGGGYGIGLCMTPDASMLFVGQHGGSSDRCVHVYTRVNGAYTYSAQLLNGAPNDTHFAQQLACNTNGTVVVATAAERTFVFTRSGQTWTRKQILDTPGASAPSFQMATAVSPDGSRIFVGKPDLGVVYCFTDTGPSYALTQTITPPGGAGGFGAFVTPAPTGGTLLVGAPGAWNNTGTVYAFGETAGWWDTLAPRIDAPTGLPNAPGFGFQLATNGTLIVSGTQNVGGFGALCTFTMGSAALFGVVDQPDSIEAQRGGQAAFTAGVTPGAVVTYRWRRNGVALTDGAGVNGTTISGSTGPTLTVGNVSRADNGAVFDCLVRSTCGTAMTRAASLSVGPDCPTDFNLDGFVDFFDYDDFVAAFEGGC